MLDKEKLVAAEAILKSLIESLPNVTDNNVFFGLIRSRFQHCIRIAEDYAAIPPEEEYINTGVRVPKAYWDTRDESLIMKGNRPQKTETGWFIFTKKKDIFDFKKMIEEKENATA